MKAVILAGGYGTRISEETHLKPKPMIEIGGKPILWHIMKIYSAHGINDFVVCCGYKGYLIKEYFANYFLHMSDVTFDMVKNEMKVHQQKAEPWRVTLVDTGEDTMTGGRLKRAAGYVLGEDAFCFTYGDGVANIDILSLVEFHKQHGKLATITAVQPPGRYGALNMDGAMVKGFIEKPSESDRLRAKKYAYHFFFRRMIPLEFMEPTGGNPPFRINLKSLNDLKSGSSRGLDLIFDGILNGTDFTFDEPTPQERHTRK